MIHQLITTVRGGNFEQEVNSAITDLCKSVREYKNSGRLTLSFEFRPADDSLAVAVQDQLVVALPKSPRATSTVWLDGDQIVADDPRRKGKTR